MKPSSCMLFFTVLYLVSSQWALQAYENPFEIIPDEESVEDSAFVKGIPETREPSINLAGSSIVENLQVKREENGLNSLEHLISTHNEEKRLKIESLMKRGSILDPGNIGDGPGPECYSCYGNSLKSCLSVKKVKQCQGLQQCYTVHLVTRATGQHSFVKGCINTAICQSDICQTIRNTSKGQFSFCKADCCKGKLCNGENAGTTKKPIGTPTSEKPPISGPKCYSCQGTDLASCGSRMTQKQCLPDYQCADAYLTTKNSGRNLVAKGCIPSRLCRSGLCKQLNSTGRYLHCRSSCCSNNLCNAIPTLPTTRGTTTVSPSTTDKSTERTSTSRQTEPSSTPSTPRIQKPTNKTTTSRSPPVTQRTLPPRPTPKPGYLCYSCNTQTAQECFSNLKVSTCSLGQVCFTGRATRNNGVKMFAKGCMRLEQCATSCKRLSLTTKNCKVDCCRGNYCNGLSLTTERPTTPQGGCFRILLQVLDVFKKLLETIDTLIKFKALNDKAPYYKREISSLMGKMNTHAFHVNGKRNPAARKAITEMRSLRKRASTVLQKLDEINAKR